MKKSIIIAILIFPFYVFADDAKYIFNNQIEGCTDNPRQAKCWNAIGSDFDVNLVCKSPSGCSFDSKTGECPDCVYIRKENTKITNNEENNSNYSPISKIKKITQEKTLFNSGLAGKYQIVKVQNDEGFYIIWDKGVFLEITTIENNLYLVKISGIGEVNGEIVNCSNHSIFSMKVDKDGKVMDRKDINISSSCPISSFTPDTQWSRTSEGLKKVKRWTETIVDGEVKRGWVCVVGPCKDIKEKTHTFYYKKI